MPARFTIRLVIDVDDLPAQPVGVHLLAEPIAQRGGEVALELLGQVGVLRHVRVQQRLRHGDLCVGEEDRELGPGQPTLRGAALGHHLGVGQNSNFRLSLPVRSSDSMVRACTGSSCGACAQLLSASVWR